MTLLNRLERLLEELGLLEPKLLKMEFPTESDKEALLSVMGVNSADVGVLNKLDDEIDDEGFEMSELRIESATELENEEEELEEKADIGLERDELEKRDDPIGLGAEDPLNSPVKLREEGLEMRELRIESATEPDKEDDELDKRDPPIGLEVERLKMLEEELNNGDDPSPKEPKESEPRE